MTPDKEFDFQNKPVDGGSMYSLFHFRSDLAKYILNCFSDLILVIFSIRRFCSFRIRFSFGVMPNLLVFLHGIFKSIVGICTVRYIATAFRQVHVKSMHSPTVIPTARHNSKLNGNSIYSSNNLYSKAIEIFTLGNTLATILIIKGQQMIIGNTNVMTYSYRKAIHHIFHRCIELFQGIANGLKNLLHFLLQCMKTSVEAAFAQGIAEQFLLRNILQGMLIMSSKIHTRQQTNKHYSSIIHSALGIFSMINGFQIIIQKAVNCNGIVHHGLNKSCYTSLFVKARGGLCR